MFSEIEKLNAFSGEILERSNTVSQEVEKLHFIAKSSVDASSRNLNVSESVFKVVNGFKTV